VLVPERGGSRTAGMGGEKKRYSFREKGKWNISPLKKNREGPGKMSLEKASGLRGARGGKKEEPAASSLISRKGKRRLQELPLLHQRGKGHSIPLISPPLWKGKKG